MAETAGAAPPRPTSPREMRLRAEWDLLEELVGNNPDRLRMPARKDTTFFVSILATPALDVATARVDPGDRSQHRREHRLRILFPRHFPALPMEAYLEQPIFHPNVHPETGFLCLWDRHVTTNTIEHAVHKTVAMLGWQLLTTESLHCMQHDAAALCAQAERLAALRALLFAPPLRGNDRREGYSSPPSAHTMRRRLS